MSTVCCTLLPFTDPVMVFWVPVASQVLTDTCLVCSAFLQTPDEWYKSVGCTCAPNSWLGDFVMWYPTDKASVLLQLPIITRFYITLSFFTTAACALEVSHKQLRTVLGTN